MAVLNFRSSIFAIVAASLVSNNYELAAAFTPSISPLVAPTRAKSAFTVRRMAKDDDIDGAQVTSARKELKFDDKTGRFFETGLDTEECIPDEEFCVIDEDTGNKMRLTIAEKERIFLDSLQVRTRICICRHSQLASSFRLKSILTDAILTSVCISMNLSCMLNAHSVILCEWQTASFR